MSNGKKHEDDDILEEILYEDDFEKLNDDIEDDEEFLKSIGIINENGNHAECDVRNLLKN